MYCSANLYNKHDEWLMQPLLLRGSRAPHRHRLFDFLLRSSRGLLVGPARGMAHTQWQLVQPLQCHSWSSLCSGTADHAAVAVHKSVPVCRTCCEALGLAAAALARCYCAGRAAPVHAPRLACGGAQPARLPVPAHCDTNSDARYPAASQRFCNDPQPRWCIATLSKGQPGCFTV